MPHGSHGMHHLQKRKRGEIEENVLPRYNRLKNLLDRMVYFTGFFAVILTIPQVTNIWFGKDASGVSLVTWLAFTCNAIIWTGYGIFHKELPLILMYVSFFILDIFVVLGIIYYG